MKLGRTPTALGLVAGLLMSTASPAAPPQWLLLDPVRVGRPVDQHGPGLDGRPIPLSDALSACAGQRLPSAYRADTGQCLPLASIGSLRFQLRGLALRGAEGSALAALQGGRIVVFSEALRLACLPGTCPVRVVDADPGCLDASPEVCDRVFSSGFENPAAKGSRDRSTRTPPTRRR